MSIENAMVKTASDALLSKLAKDVSVLHVGDATVITDYFIIATANNTSQMDAMIDGVEEAMQQAGYSMKTREGRSQGGWVLLDYNEVVVHIFSPSMREFYNLDGTWRDVPSEKIS